MNILEILYTREFKNISYNVRKTMIDAKKLLLVGPRGSGKSSMCLTIFLLEEEVVFYISILMIFVSKMWIF